MVVNFIHGKIPGPKEFNLMEDIKISSSLFKDITIDYCNKLNNSDFEAMAKVFMYTHVLSSCTLCFDYK